MPSMIKADDYITITMDDGDSFTVTRDQKCFVSVLDAVKRRDFAAARELSDPRALLNKSVEGQSNVEIVKGEVLYKGIPMHNTLTERMVEMLEQGLQVEPMIIFLDNLMQNPSHRAVNELYGFLEYGKLPITDDGHFLAYKRIKSDWTDCYTGTINNRVGQEVHMERNEVDDNCNHTCSAGLHFCSREYVDQFWGERVVMIKIHPKDVVSIPTDYNNTKGRCCAYTVLAEIKPETAIEGAYQDTTSLKDLLGGVKQVSFDTRAKARHFCNEHEEFKFVDNGIKSVNRWGAIKRDEEE